MIVNPLERVPSQFLVSRARALTPVPKAGPGEACIRSPGRQATVNSSDRGRSPETTVLDPIPMTDARSILRAFAIFEGSKGFNSRTRAASFRQRPTDAQRYCRVDTTQAD